MNEQKKKQIERAAKAGFTLMEVMIAVMIIGLLTAVAVPAIGTYMKKARVTATYEQLAAINQALNTYKMDHNDKLPESLDALTEGDEPLIQADSLKDAWGNDFKFEKEGKKHFTVTSAGDDEEFGTEDDQFISSRNKKKNN